MKPSERIEQICAPLRETTLQVARTACEKLNGGPISEEEWDSHLRSIQMKAAFEQLDVNLKVVALVQYLDEQAQPVSTSIGSPDTSLSHGKRCPGCGSSERALRMEVSAINVPPRPCAHPWHHDQ